MIDPYELLGVTTNSTLKELKTSFYSLSLLMHPDKGGSSEEMIILQSSYDWIKNQLTNVENNKKNFKELVESYTFSNIKSFSEIFDEIVFDTRKFNEDFDKLNIGNNDIINGECIDIKNGYDEYNNDEYIDFLEKNVIVYRDPEPLETTPITIGKKIDNFSIDKPFSMSDYKEAYTVKPYFAESGVQIPIERTFDEILKEREEL